MGKIAEGNAELLAVKICLDCKTKNSVNVIRCRKCKGSRFRKKDLAPRIKK
ncbi:MAG: 50S ribosomal protein L40e [Candidatus Micrarchaeota archaeon]|nr:50S ribosomal protein L40e [Candidatus Micrarchaeota archaeon]MCX8154675.1 50S ribosomal protein L40e [Candidatus Micrarchaeota archaeon]